MGFVAKHKDGGSYGVVNHDGQWLEGYVVNSKEEAQKKAEALNNATIPNDQISNEIISVQQSGQQDSDQNETAVNGATESIETGIIEQGDSIEDVQASLVGDVKEDNRARAFWHGRTNTF